MILDGLRFSKLYVVFRLRILNIIFVLCYRLKCRISRNIREKSDKKNSTSPLFTINKQVSAKSIGNIDVVRRYCSHADKILSHQFYYFFSKWFFVPKATMWRYNPYVNRSWETTSQHWKKLSYFSRKGDDVKAIWELSRCYWVPQLACAYQVSGDKKYLDKLEDLLDDWQEKNPVGFGYQWMCAQEASIRLINITLSQWILGVKGGLTQRLKQLMIGHVERILPTMHYARAQQNNHATSEAAGVYIAGVFLQVSSGSSQKEKKRANKYMQIGKRALENSAKTLIMLDGGFSQYSLTYHRLVLDTLSLCVFYQRKFEQTSFSDGFMQQYKRAYQWLYSMVDPTSYDAPNIGANDGVLFFDLTLLPYRDFRPTLQLACALLENKLCFDDESSIILDWLHLPVSGIYSPNRDAIEYKKSGFVKMQAVSSWAAIRHPVFRFRPSQCDALHMDLWVQGKNVLCDSGTYSYNGPSNLQSLASVCGHNTVEIDKHDQMPKLSRFLYGAWLRGKVLTPMATVGSKTTWKGQYIDKWGGRHIREVVQYGNKWEIHDCITGHQSQATLRWHLSGADWDLQDHRCCSKTCEITVTANVKPAAISLDSCQISLAYLSLCNAWCLAATVKSEKPISFKTVIEIH